MEVTFLTETTTSPSLNLGAIARNLYAETEKFTIGKTFLKEKKE